MGPNLHIDGDTRKISKLIDVGLIWKLGDITRIYIIFFFLFFPLNYCLKRTFKLKLTNLDKKEKKKIITSTWTMLISLLQVV